MLSPAKAITAGALVFAIGGVFLIAQPFDRQGAGVPEAATEAPPLFSGWIEPGPSVVGGWSPTITVDEPRLDGIAYYSHAQKVIDDIAVRSTT